MIRGERTAVRNLVLARARVPDSNGAGIRLEAQDLTLDHVRFRNNEVGLLAGQPGPGAIRIRDCAFEAGGVPAPRPTAAVLVSAVALLQVERTTFNGVKGNQLSTEAVQTELTANTVETGTDPGAGYAVVANGGLLRMDGNTLSIGPNPPPRAAAVLAVSGATILRNNRLLNASGARTVLLLDWTHDTPVLSGNQVPPGDEESSTAGLLRHRASSAAHATYDGARHLAGGVKRAMLRLFRD